jgi:hypothetical protein
LDFAAAIDPPGPLPVLEDLPLLVLLLVLLPPALLLMEVALAAFCDGLGGAGISVFPSC